MHARTRNHTPVRTIHSPIHPSHRFEVRDEPSQLPLPARNLRSLDSRQLLRPSCRGLHLLHGAQLVARETGDADVVVALEDELQVADFELGGLAELGELAGGDDDLVDEFVGDGEEDLLGGGLVWVVGG